MVSPNTVEVLLESVKYTLVQLVLSTDHGFEKRILGIVVSAEK